MSVPILSELREPPIVGRYYMVPVIENYPWRGRVRDWPVMGPLHTDVDFFNFPDAHYHVDLRFVPKREYDAATGALGWHRSTGDRDRDATLVAQGYPLQSRGVPLPIGRPTLQRRKCGRSIAPASLLNLADKAREKMIARYGNPADPIRKPDGRLLCPHRKADLSTFEPDASGIVICPLHGLRVRCGSARMAA